MEADAHEKSGFYKRSPAMALPRRQEFLTPFSPMVSGERLKPGRLDLGEFRSEPIVLRLLFRGPRIIREGDVRCLEGIVSQIVHFPLARHDTVGIVILGQFVPRLADAGDVVWGWRKGRKARVRAALLARLVVIVRKDNVVLNRRGR